MADTAQYSQELEALGDLVHPEVRDGARAWLANPEVTAAEAQRLLARWRDPRPTPALFHEALAAVGAGAGEGEPEALAVLRLRASAEVFEMARAWCRAVEPERRRLGALVLGGLGVYARPYAHASVGILQKLLRDPVPEAMLAGLAALGQLKVSRVAPLALRLREHPDAAVRRTVAGALGGLDDRRGYSALVELSRDPEPAVRRQAVYALAVETAADTPAIRDALAARLADATGPAAAETRGLAHYGLARRGEKCGLDALAVELAGDAPDEWAVAAAGEWALARFAAPLHRLAARGWTPAAALAAALAACAPDGGP